jgi:hypothetical protein
MIVASEVAREVEQTPTTVGVGNEAQARELARVEPDRRAEVWQKAVEETAGKPTAAAVRAVASADSVREERRAAQALKRYPELANTAPPSAEAPGVLAAAQASAQADPVRLVVRGMESLAHFVECVDKAGGVDAVVARLNTPPADALERASGALDAYLSESWLTQLDRYGPVVDGLHAALRRRRMRSVQ